MPRQGPRRTGITVRFTDEQIEALDWQANVEGFVMASGEPNRSELVRVLVAYAQKHMPEGWRPDSE